MTRFAHSFPFLMGTLPEARETSWTFAADAIHGLLARATSSICRYNNPSGWQSVAGWKYSAIYGRRCGAEDCEFEF